MSPDKVNNLNIGLMLGATALAFVLPFELFLFSYAVLGPLHYLTEISWLHKQNYFIPKRNDFIILVVVCCIVTGVNLFLTPLLKNPEWYTVLGSEAQLKVYVKEFFHALANNFRSWITVLMSFAFLSALAMLLFKRLEFKIGFLVLALIGSLMIKDSHNMYVMLGVFLPTIIHVFVFTGAFILYGALKGKSRSGMISLVVFVLCALSFFVITPEFGFYKVGDYVSRSMQESGFIGLNREIIKFFHLGTDSPATLYESVLGISLMRFIAFAYTYHYLNWFSKTSIIKWHEVNKTWLTISIVVWVLSVALYVYDYTVGLKALFLLSMLHVFLEFPLNFKTFIAIGDETIKLSGLKPAPAAAPVKSKSQKRRKSK